MKYSVKKFRKDIFENFGSFLTISIVIAVGIAFFVGLQASYKTMSNSIKSYYHDSNLADYWITFSSFTNEDLSSIKEYDGIDDMQPRIQTLAASDENSILLQSYNSDYKINKPVILSGSIAKAINDICLDSAYMNTNNLNIGDSIDIKINNEKYSFKISGTFQSSEYIYYTDDATVPVPNHKSYGIGLVSEKFFKDNLKMTYNQLLITVKNNIKEKDLISKFQNTFDNYIYSINQNQQLSNKMVESKLKTIQNMSGVLPVIFILLASVITIISMSRQVESQRSQIAIMKACGISNRKIIVSYMLYPLLTSFIGCILGSIFGILLFPKVLISTLEILFIFPNLSSAPCTHFIVIGFGLSLILGCIATQLACRKILKESPAQALRPSPPKKSTSSFLEKNFLIWNKLSYSNKLIVRNISMNKKRFILSSFGIIFCTCTMIASFGMKSSLSEIINSEFNDYRKYDVTATLSNPTTNPSKLNMGYFKNVKSYDIFSSTNATYNDKNTTLNIINTDATSLILYNSDHKPITMDSTGVYVSEKFAQQHNLSIGEKVKITINSLSVLSENFEATIIGIYSSYTSQGFYTTFEFLKTLDIDYPILSILATAGNSPKTLQSELLDNDAFSHVTIKDEQKEDYINASSSINTMILIMIIASATLVFTVIYNVSSINIFERRRDIATEKVLGLNIQKINQLIFAENLILVIFSCIFGILLSHQFYVLLCNSIAPEEMAFPNTLSIQSIPYAIALVFIFTILTNNFLKGKVKSINMIESLKSVE